MVKGGHGAGFKLKAAHHLFIGSRGIIEDFYCDGTAQQQIGGLKDGGKAAFSDLSFQFIAVIKSRACVSHKFRFSDPGLSPVGLWLNWYLKPGSSRPQKR